MGRRPRPSASLTKSLCFDHAFLSRTEVIWPVKLASSVAVMVTIIFLGACLTGEAFLLYCLFHFAQEEMRTWRSNKSKTALFLENQEIVQAQMVARVSTAIWAQGEWTLRTTDHSEQWAKLSVSLRNKE